MSTAPEPDEAAEVRARYARRHAADRRYSLLEPAALLASQERQRALQRAFRTAGIDDVARVTLLEVGSGGGGNLLEMLWLGFAAENLAGVELLAERHATARARLPEAVRLTLGDATTAPLGASDVVYVSTVFSSLLDDAFQQRLAAAIWAAVKPGGAVLWYDFTVDNPRNPDVRGVPLTRVRALFPHGRVGARRTTLAPPIARRVCRLHPALYTWLNALPFLRTHVVAWIAKPPLPSP
ncbi:class I SAM-dependent methyltransferase [Piscinibacter koreensis]|uniref:Class I SAM-dependent methyltransferase n=1 Tax=Piscinibacter koreensis TaxID=2742824 RepID=A0A7Y6NPI8_9BURK|nr:class I SAM-dependent methyltransferase [Schlegelella koreensis]NUZ06987.1 class I SAM-dependent methyltransferase [Schlegelella koreensis]